MFEGAVDLESHYGGHYSGFRNDPVFAEKVRAILNSHLLPLLPSAASILDVGCGNGEFLTAAAERGCKTFGLDFSLAAAELCRERGLMADSGDFLAYEFKDRSPFDLVTFWDVCEHLQSPMDFIAKALTLVKPGGYVVVKVPLVTSRTVDIVRRFPRLAGALLGSPLHIHYFRKNTLEYLLERAGFGSLTWLPNEPLRGTNQSGSLKKRLARGVRTALQRWAGDGSLLVAARRPL
ncbi:MAG: class I SAM-dependent methyltransferase [Deltaproteobacteria bacterium]|nr:class I SAM-dependent methyltransferase [Deltaproteobacteria bacterium]